MDEDDTYQLFEDFPIQKRCNKNVYTPIASSFNWRRDAKE